MRFASHRDVARAIERGVRKAGVPVAYSAGFSPHPRISYSGGAPTGSASEAEYLELSVTRRCEPADIGKTIHPHPTLSESIGMSAEAFEGVCTDLPPQKKARQ